MKKSFDRLLWGIILIALGLAFMGQSLGLWGFNIFFDGWWTLFIIIPCLVSIIKNGFNSVNIAGLVIGLLFLLAEQGIFELYETRKLIFPAILIIIGFSIIYRGTVRPKTEVVKVENNNLRELTAIFGGQDVSFAKEKFNGANLTAIFGGVSINLKESVIEEDVKINATAIFGGVDVFLPPNVKAKVFTTPIFGGVINKAIQSEDENAPTVYIYATCIFGGVEVS